MKKIFFLIAIMLASVTPSSAETYEEWVAKCKSYRDVDKWMQQNFMWDNERAKENSALIKEGKYNKLRSPADTFRKKSGSSPDSAIFMKYTLDQINPAYRAELIVYSSFYLRIGALACSFYLDDKLYVMDYSGPSRRLHGVHGPFKDLNDFAKRHVERYLGRDGKAKYVKFEHLPWEYAENQTDQILAQMRKKVEEIEETQKALLALKNEEPKKAEEKPKPAAVNSQEKEIKQAKKKEPIPQLPIVSPKIQEEKKFASSTKQKEILVIKEPARVPEKLAGGIKDADKEKKIAEMDERLKTPAGVDPTIKEIKEFKKTEPGTQPVFATPKLPEEKKTAPPAKEKEILKAKDSPPAPEKQSAGIKDLGREKKIAELNERLQKAMQALKDLEEMKKKMAAQQKIEAELSARLRTLEAEKIAQPKNLPVIAIANPKEGITVDSEYISLFGVAEHEKGITRFEIRVNNQPVDFKGQRDLKVVPKGQKRIEFSERIRLKEGKNELTIIAQEKEGLVAQKTISLQMTKKRGEVWAVVVGISKYKNIPSLKYASRDAQEFYRYLTEVNRVPKDNIWLLLDEEATLNKLRSTLGTHLRRKAGKDDLVMIYLAGHGGTEKDAASYDRDGLEKYILPHNADPKDLYASAMPMSEVARIFQRISSERLVFISDTCYSGASGGRTLPLLGTRANVSGAFLERLSQGRGRVIITASGANEVSLEKDELKHGVFTYYLLEALRGKGDLDGDGVISVDEAYRYVSAKVPEATGQDQHPVKKGEVTGQIVLGVVK